MLQFSDRKLNFGSQCAHCGTSYHLVLALILFPNSICIKWGAKETCLNVKSCETERTYQFIA